MAETSSSLTDEERAQLGAYLDGELTGPEAQALEAKLQKDPQARAEAEALRRTWQLLDYLPRPEPSPSFTSQTLERVSLAQPKFRLGRWRRWGLGFAWAAAILVAGGFGFAGGRLLPGRRSAPAVSQAEADREITQDRRVIENLPLYEPVGNLEFLKNLADPGDPDLFGDDHLDS